MYVKYHFTVFGNSQEANMGLKLLLLTRSEASLRAKSVRGLAGEFGGPAWMEERVGEGSEAL